MTLEGARVIVHRDADLVLVGGHERLEERASLQRLHRHLVLVARQLGRPLLRDDVRLGVALLKVKIFKISL